MGTGRVVWVHARSAIVTPTTNDHPVEAMPDLHLCRTVSVETRVEGETTMSQTYGVDNNTRRQGSMQERPSSWAIGWTVFAAIMLMVQGGWWIMAGLIALFNSEFYVVGQEYIFQLDVTSWGWIHLIVGVVLVAAGFGLFSGAVWARTVGVLVAAIAMLIAFAWMPWYPLWAVLFVVISAAVIWSLTAHGRDITRG